MESVENILKGLLMKKKKLQKSVSDVTRYLALSSNDFFFKGHMEQWLIKKKKKALVYMRPV